MRSVIRRLTLTALALGGIIGCVAPSNEKPTPYAGDALHDVESLAWLTGSWAANGANYRWEEHWSTPKGGTMVAMGRMVESGQTAFTESIRIETRADGIHFVVTPYGQPTTDFKLLEHSGWQAIFVSETHRIPHTLGYRLQPDGVLLAWTENERDGKTWKEFFPMQPSAIK